MKRKALGSWRTLTPSKALCLSCFQQGEEEQRKRGEIEDKHHGVRSRIFSRLGLPHAAVASVIEIAHGITMCGKYKPKQTQPTKTQNGEFFENPRQ